MDLSNIPEETTRGRLRPLCGLRVQRLRLEPQQSLVQGIEEDYALDSGIMVINCRAGLEGHSRN